MPDKYALACAKPTEPRLVFHTSSSAKPKALYSGLLPYCVNVGGLIDSWPGGGVTVGFEGSAREV